MLGAYLYVTPRELSIRTLCLFFGLSETSSSFLLPFGLSLATDL